MLKIGDFSKLARVSVKALRHYDKIGLLRPVYVDPSARYRYYVAEQILQLNRILLLKDMGFGLQEVRRLLKEQEELGSALQARRDELEAEITTSKERLHRLDALIQALKTEPRPATVLVREIPAVPALVARETLRSGDGRITHLFEALERRAARANARADSSPFLLFHDASWSDPLDVEICVPVKSEARTMEGVRTVEGCAKAGSITYRGPYEQSRPHFASLARWIDANGGKLGTPLREVYHRFGADQVGYRLPNRVLAPAPHDYLTELQAPMTKESTQ